MNNTEQAHEVKFSVDWVGMDKEIRKNVGRVLWELFIETHKANGGRLVG